MESNVVSIIHQFQIPAGKIEADHYGSGHINVTYRVQISAGGTVYTYILQKINRHVFERPDKVVENIRRVTAFLSKKSVQKAAIPNGKR